MPDKLMYILNDDTQNYQFCRLQLVIESFEHSANRNSLPSSYKTLGTSVKNSPLSLPSLYNKALP